MISLVRIVRGGHKLLIPAHETCGVPPCPRWHGLLFAAAGRAAESDAVAAESRARRGVGRGAKIVKII